MEDKQTVTMKRLFTQMIFCCVTLAFLASMSACSARRSQPIRGPLAMNKAAVRNGQVYYMQHCHRCHPVGEAGLGPALNNKPLPGFMVRFQVRQGMGVMPAFKRDQISQEELGDIVAYMRALRRN
jgi:mono/diheme cytochrome c family protein